MKVLVFGNSGSGKPGKVAVQRPEEDIRASLREFLAVNDRWVIEGCYGELVEQASAHCDELVFLNPGLDACLANNRRRPRWRRDGFRRILPAL